MDGQGPQRAIAALLSISLAAGCLPVGALALEESADVAMTGEVAAEVSKPDIEEVAHTTEAQVEPAPATEADQVPELNAEAEETVCESVAVPEQALEGPSEAETSAVMSEAEASAEGEKVEALVPAQEDAASQAAQSPLAQVARLVIQDKEDESKPEVADVTKLKVGDTLWVHAFDKDGKLVGLDDKKVTYRWLAADKPSTDPKTFVEVVGTKESLKLTPELAGRYVIVEVSEGTTQSYGPLSVPKEEETPHLEALLLPSVPKQAEEAPAASERSASETPTLSAQAVTTAKTPTSEVDEEWSVGTAPVATSSSSSTIAAVSEPVVVDGKLVVFSGVDALVLSPSTGKVLARHKSTLPAAVATPCDPLVYQGVIYVPLADGSVVALDASDSSNTSFLSKRWTSEALVDGGAIGCSLSLTEHSGKTYLVVGLSSGAATGALVTLDAATGKQMVSAQSPVAGYGESGALVQKDVVYVGDSSGVLHAMSLSTGQDVSCLSLSSSGICGKVVACGDALLVADRSGVLHKVTVDANGVLAEADSVRVGKGCASSPVVVGQIAVCGVCGQEGRETSDGALVIVDVNQMRVSKRVTSADGAPLAQGGVTAEPLVSIGTRDTWCYFAVNGPMGAVYAYRVGDAQATELYVPAGKKADRCDHPLVADADGSIYYLNASGLLAKLVTAAENAPVLPPVPAKTQHETLQPERPSEQSAVKPVGDVTQDNAQGGPGVEDPSMLEGPIGAPEGALDSAYASEGEPTFIPDGATPLAASNSSSSDISQVSAQVVAEVYHNNGPANAVKTLTVGMLGSLAYIALRHRNESQQQ